MMVELIKNYTGECIVDQNGSYTFSDLKTQINDFKTLVAGKFEKHDRVLFFIAAVVLISMIDYDELKKALKEDYKI